MLELLFPKSCAGCGAAGVSLCASCQEELRRVPHRVSCTVDPRVPVWALSPYAGAHRQLVSAGVETHVPMLARRCGQRWISLPRGANFHSQSTSLWCRPQHALARHGYGVATRSRRCVRPQAYRRSRACNTAVQCGILWGLMLLRGVETWRKAWTCFKCRRRQCCWWTML